MNGLPVLIVGAGPTGLALAVELARFDVPVRIVDRAEAPVVFSQALAIQPRTLELLEPSGVSERLLPYAHAVRGLRLRRAGRPVLALEMSGIRSKYEEIAIVPQSRTEAVLAQRLREHGVTVERGVELSALDEGPTGVHVTLRGGAGEERLTVDRLAGCDGAHSTVRHLTGRRFGGHTVDERFLLADVVLDTALDPDRAAIDIDAGDAILAAFPFGGGRWRLIVIGASATPTTDAAQLQALLHAHGVDGRIDELLWAAPFRVNQRRVDVYASDRVFLLGDAAHIHSPIGGQGMNSGIGDAVNLAWKIALTYHQRLDGRLIATYATERAEIGRQLLLATDAANRVILAPPPWLAALRDRVAPLAVRNDRLRRRIVETVTQLRIAYPHSPLSVDDGRGGHDRAGTRVQGARIAGYRPQAILLHADDQGEALTLVVRPDGYHGYVARGLHPSGAAIYQRNVIGLRDALDAP